MSARLPAAAGRDTPLPARAASGFVHRLVLALLLGWIVLGCAGQLHLVWYGSLADSVDQLFDDAYYYLGVAWNLANGHGSRFTEPLQTNGYHPLWLLLLTGLTAAFDLSKQGLFAATLVLTALVKCAGIWLFERDQPDPLRRTIGRIAVFIAIVKFPFVFSFGLETTLFIVFIPWLLRRARVSGWSTRDALLTGGLMALVFLTRLDALALDAAVLLLAFATRRATWRAAAVAFVPLAVTIAVYLAVNQAVFGTPLPVSGQAKGIGSQLAANLDTALDYVRALRWVALMLLVWAAATLLLARRLPLPGFELACLGLALVACALYYGALSGWPIWPWYLYPNALLALYATAAAGHALPALADWLYDTLRRFTKPLLLKGGAALLGATVAASYLLGIVLDSQNDAVRGHLLARFLKQETRNGTSSSFNAQNVALIPWLDERYPAGTTIAMGDRAGGLGYWMPARHALIHIEGLVADKAFLATLRAGRLEADLAERRVALYIGDRPRVLTVDGVMGFVEPVQPRVTAGAMNILCFDYRGQLLAQDYRWGDDPQLRRVFDFERRVACPANLLAQATALRARYDGIRSNAGF